MIDDINIGGVLVPGLLMVACVALAATVTMLHFLSALGLTRLFAWPSLVELATFATIFGLLVQVLTRFPLTP